MGVLSRISHGTNAMLPATPTWLTFLMLLMLSLNQSAPLPAPTTVLVDLVPLVIGSSLIIKGIFFGNSIAHLANDDNRFREPRGSNHHHHQPPQYYHQPGLYRYKLSGV